jgi:hypothetical protein
MTHLWAFLKRRIAELIRAIDAPPDGVPTDGTRTNGTHTDDDARDDGPGRLTR